MNTGEDTRAVSPVIAVILMVAVTVVLSAVVGGFVFNLGQNMSDGESTSDVGAQVSHDGNGNVTVQVITGTADELRVLVDGNVSGTLANPSPGDSISVTASEGSLITVVTERDGKSSIVLTDSVGAGTGASGPGLLTESWTYDSKPSTLTNIDAATVNHDTENGYTADYAVNYTISVKSLYQPTWHYFFIGTNNTGVSITLGLDDSSYQEESMRIREWQDGNGTILYDSGNMGSNAVSVGDRLNVILQYNASSHKWRGRIEFTDGTLPYSTYESGWVAGGNFTTSDMSGITYWAHGSNSNVQYDGTNNVINMYADRGWGPYSRVYVETANITNQLP